MIGVNNAYKVFISSPGGLDVEKAIAVAEIQALSDQRESTAEPGLTVVAWPHDIAAGSGSYGQSVINRQIAEFDILLCIVGSRMGTRTPRANSGTEEEFDRAIDAALRGRRVQVLLFFSNSLVRLQDVDPQQLFLIKAFQAKASRLGVLYQYYNDTDSFRHLVAISLREACDAQQEHTSGRYSPQIPTAVNSAPTLITLSDVTLVDGLGPQRAAEYLIPLASHRGRCIRITGTFSTNSEYFRFGFKYYDAREPLFSAGSVQTVGQNVLFHIAKNTDRPEWFSAVYRAGYRAEDNTYISATAEVNTANFEIVITPTELVTFRLNDEELYQRRFPIDGIPNIALLAWGDEHHFRCDLTNLLLTVESEGLA